MKLHKYITKLGLTHAEFAKEIGVTRSTISRCLIGLSSRKTAKKIVAHSDGKVTYGELYNETKTLHKQAT